MIRTSLFALVAFASLIAAAAYAADEPAAAKPAPVRALLITGGCCHDYDYQAAKLVAGSKKIANVEWTVLKDPRTGTEGEIELYNDPDWAKPYDVIVHNECFANTKDPAYIRKITDAHKAGAPAVVIHCAMHTYRAAEIDDWRELLGVTSRHHEHQAEYAVTPTEAGKAHPAMKKFPAQWKTPKDELYVVEKVWPNTIALATSKSEKTGDTQPVFWASTYGKARVFGTTYGHGNATWDDAVFIDTVTRGTLWAAGKLTDAGEPVAGYEPVAAADAIAAQCKLCDAKLAEAMSQLAAGESDLPPAMQAALRNYHSLHAANAAPTAAAVAAADAPPAADWSHQMIAKLPAGEKPIDLFNGKDLAGWTGLAGRWSVEDGVIVTRNEDKVPTSTYLFTDKPYRNFRLLVEAKQTRSPKHSTMHTAIAALGERFEDKGGNTHGFRGPLLMCCDDWGIWDAYRRNRIVPPGHPGQFRPAGVEKVGDWNRIEILVIGDRIRFATNGKLVFDYTEPKPEMLRSSPIGLQLHSNDKPQEHRFRGLVLVENPTDAMITLE